MHPNNRTATGPVAGARLFAGGHLHAHLRRPSSRRPHYAFSLPGYTDVAEFNKGLASAEGAPATVEVVSHRTPPALLLHVQSHSPPVDPMLGLTHPVLQAVAIEA